ncbi:MAG: methyltransferase domain-containing protein [Anaeromyxobacter sp.]
MSAGGCSTTASLRERAGRVYAALAFGRAAAVYGFLTDHPAWRADCRAMAALATGPRVLDLGVGPGTSALEMARADPARRHVGLDRSGGMLRLAADAARRAALRLPLVQADALALPLRTGSVDGATAHSLLYLVPDAAAALREVARVLRPGGRLVLLEPRAGPASLRSALRRGGRCAASMVMWRSMSRLHRRFAEPELRALLEEAGLGEARAWPVLDGYGVMATASRPG